MWPFRLTAEDLQVLFSGSSSYEVLESYLFLLEKQWDKFPSYSSFNGYGLLIYTPISFGVWSKRE